MLKVKIETEEGVRYKYILVIDAHSHLGKDVDGAEMMNPLTPGRGTFDFWSGIQGLIEQEWAKTGEKSIETKINGKDHILTFDFEMHPFVQKMFKQLEEINSSSYKDLRQKTKDQQFIDQGVVFPFQDVFRAKMPEALFHASNINVARVTTRFPFSLRLIGYMRVDPMEHQKAINEIDFGVSLGLRGLKLHPRSEGWIDKINSEWPVRVLAHAAKYSLPVIFDTRGKGSILAIGELVKSARNYIQSNAPELLPHFKVIIAHFAQGNVGDEEVYRTICQPNTWGDLSMLHGKGAENFLKDFKKWFIQNNMKQKVDGRDWSEFILYATDFPYFGAVHAKGLIFYLMNKSFFENGGTLEDTENIMGLNQLRLLPEYNYRYVEKNNVPALSSVITTPDPNINAQDIAIKAIAKLIDSNVIDIKNVLFQFDGSYRNYKGELMLNTISKRNKEYKVNLILTNMVKDKMVMLSTLSVNSEWKKFGYKYFNPDDREFFHSVLKQTKPSIDESQAFEIIKAAYPN
ncbi:MAG: amidohydrolase family protein [Promethearchaeota archaeon]